MATNNRGVNTASAGIADLKRRLLFVLFAILVFRIGSYIPVPGLNPQRLQDLFNAQQNNIIGLFNMFSGGALMRFSLFALGIYPLPLIDYHAVIDISLSQLAELKRR